MTTKHWHAEFDVSAVARLWSRRSLLLSAGGAATAFVPYLARAGSDSAAEPHEDILVPQDGKATAADYPVSDIMLQVSQYISGARDRVLTPEVLERAKWALLDSFAAMVSGSQLPSGRAAIAFARAYGGKPTSTLIGDLGTSGPIEAALTNAMMGHADETDDVVRGNWHPGCTVVPATLALGEQFGISGMHFLRALTVGYDIGTRVMVASGVQMNFRVPTNSMGSNLGATAASACAASLTAEQVRWALAYAAQQDSGIDDFRRDVVHIEKAFMDGGMGARNGVTAALLVLAGASGVNDIFAGPVSFFSRYQETARPQELVDKLGELYYVTRARFKHWPVGGPIQIVLDAMQVLLAQHPIDPKKVHAILIRYGGGPGSITDNSGPSDINVQHAVALMLLDKKVTFSSIHDHARMRDPEVVRLRSITKVLALSPGMDVHVVAGLPAIEITLAGGQHITQDSVEETAVGTAGNPYTREWFIGKARSLMTPVVGSARTSELIDRVLTLEHEADIRGLRPLLQPHGSGATQPSQWPIS